MSVVRRYTAYINSRQRVRGTPDEFSVQMYPPYTLTNQRHFFRVQVLNACVPFSFPQVNSVNGGLVIDIGGTPYTVNITPGNYTILTLLEEVKTRVIAQAATAGFTITLSSSYNKTTGRVTMILTSSVPATTVTLQAGTTVARMLGIATAQTLTLALGVTFDAHVDVNPVRSLYIRSDNLTQRENIENLLEKSVVSDVLAEIPIQTNPGTYIVMFSPGNEIRITNKVIDQIELYLSSTDDYRLQGLDLDWTCLLEIVEYAPETFEMDPLASALAPPSTVDDRLEELRKEKERLLADLQAEKERLKKSIR